jgi:hypothetical protein
MRGFRSRVASGTALAAALALGAGGIAAVPASAAEGTSCASDTGTAKLSPGLTGVARVQKITIKGVLGGCTGSTGATGKYVVHLTMSAPATCQSLQTTGGAAEGTSAIKWGKGHGTSLGTLSIAGSPGSGLTLAAALTAGPFAGLGVSTTITGEPVFTGIGFPCTSQNPLKQLTLTGTSPFVIS